MQAEQAENGNGMVRWKIGEGGARGEKGRLVEVPAGRHSSGGVVREGARFS